MTHKRQARQAAGEAGNTPIVQTADKTAEEQPRTGKASDVAWVVLLTINHGFFDFFLNWLAHYRRLKLPYQVRVLAEDDLAFRKIKALREPNLVVDRSPLSVQAAADYESKEYIKLVSARPEYLLRYLRNRASLAGNPRALVSCL